MVLYSFYIFDRHTECIYSRRWTPTPQPPTTTRPTSSSSSDPSSAAPSQPSTQHPAPSPNQADEEKLLFGLIFSLRNLTTKLHPDSTFLSYSTPQYKLHYYETPTRMKFVMLTSPGVVGLRQYLHQVWANLYVEYVVKNPLAPVEHGGGAGVRNELFERGLEAFVRAVLPV